MNGYYEQNRENNALMKVYDAIKHTDIAEEFILPDYLPDVKRIIKADVTPKIDGKFISSGKIDYEGDVIIHILFCDEANHLKNATFTASFNDGVEVNGIEDECVANLIPCAQSVSCKMLNPRRVSVRMRLDTAITVWCHKSFEPKFLGDFSDEIIQKSQKSVNVMELVCAGESGLTVSADLEADGALPQIGEIIGCNVDISFYECKGSDGKVLCRGDMPITVYYSSNDDENEAYTVLLRKLPVAQVVLAEGVTEDYSCMARGAIDSVKYNVIENGFGERRIIEIEVTYRVYLNCVGNGTVEVINDVYALGKNVKIEKEKQSFCHLSRLYSSSFAANLVLSREELGIENAYNVFALSAVPEIDSISCEGTKLTVTGNAKTSAVIKAADGLVMHQYDVPFKTELDAPYNLESFEYNYDIVCVGAKGRFDSEKLYTELDMQLNLMLLESQEIDVLTKAEFTERESESSGAQMRFYYPNENETLWDIGKQFGVSVGELVDKNDITGEEVPRVLYIPII